MRRRGLVGRAEAVSGCARRSSGRPARSERARARVFATTRATWLTGGLVMFIQSALAQAPLPVYTDHLVNGFQDWSWAGHDLATTGSFVRSGSDSISVSATAWQAV